MIEIDWSYMIKSCGYNCQIVGQKLLSGGYEFSQGYEVDMIYTSMVAMAFKMMKRSRQIRNAIYFVPD